MNALKLIEQLSKAIECYGNLTVLFGDDDDEVHAIRCYTKEGWYPEDEDHDKVPDHFLLSMHPFNTEPYNMSEEER